MGSLEQHYDQKMLGMLTEEGSSFWARSWDLGVSCDRRATNKLTDAASTARSGTRSRPLDVLSTRVVAGAGRSRATGKAWRNAPTSTAPSS